MSYSFAESNAEAMSRIAEVYFKQDDLILDMTFGKGTFWKEIAGQFRGVCLDIDPTIRVNVRGDFRRLPFPDETFDVTVFDPPYYGHGSSLPHDKTRQVQEFFNESDEPTRNLYLKGLMEAGRVTKNKGLIVVKCTNGCEYTDMPTWIRGLRIGRVIDEVISVRLALRNWHPGVKRKIRTVHSFFLVLRNSYYGRIEATT